MGEHPRWVHDLGGLEAGPIDRREHENDFWEQRVDALMRVLATLDPPLVRTDELRRGIEGLGAEAYGALSYYQLWITSIAQNLLEKNVLTIDELGRKIAEIESREAG